MRQTIIQLAAILLASAVPAIAQDQTPAADAAAPSPMIPLNVPSNPPMTGPKLLIATAMGDITLQLDAVRAPRTVANILRYVREKHYDGTVVYRVARGFVLEMGSWDANVKGRPVHPGGVPLEANNGLRNLRGAVSLARGDDPSSGQADFFINIDANGALDQAPDDHDNKTGYAVFGEVTDGMEVVDRISTVPVGDHGPMKGEAPVTPILITKVSVIGDPPSAAAPKKKK